MITCTITSPSENKIYKNLKSVVVPASSGNMEIRAGHAEAFILLSIGEVILRFLDGEEMVIKSGSGECHVKDDEVIVVF